MEPTVTNCSDSTDSAVAGTEPRPSARDSILSGLDELCCLTDGLLAAALYRDLVAARVRVAEDRFNLVVLGEFKRGKSTLVNALLDRDVLPTGVIPLTSVVTLLGPGPVERLVIRFIDGREEEHNLDELAAFVTEACNPRNVLGVDVARVELDHRLLRAGLELVDTPGTGSIHSHNSEVARGFLPRVDAALCVPDGGQPLSEGERELLAEAAGRLPRLLVVVNKLDHLEAQDREQAIEFIRSALRDVLAGQEAELFPLSARNRDGIDPLVNRLLRLAAEERETLLLRSVARLARGLAADGARAARFEAHAIELPLDELAARAQQFEQRIAELQAASAEAADLLERGVARALRDRINEPLSEHAKRDAPRLQEALHAHLVPSIGRRRASWPPSSSSGSIRPCATSSSGSCRDLSLNSPTSSPTSSAATPLVSSASSNRCKTSPRTSSAPVLARCCPKPGCERHPDSPSSSKTSSTPSTSSSASDAQSPPVHSAGGW